MAKRKNTGRRSSTPPKATPEAAHKLADEANAAAEEHDVATASEDPVDETTTIAEAIEAATTAKATFSQVANALEQKVGDCEAQLEKLKSDRSELDEERSALTSRQAELDKSLTSLQERLESIEQREADLASKQAEAEAGFLDRREEILGPIRERLIELTNSWHEQERQLLEDWDNKLKARRSELETELEADRESLANERAALDALSDKLKRRQADLEREARRLVTDQELLDEDRAELDRVRATLEERIEREVERVRREMGSDGERLRARVAELEESDRTLRRLRAEFSDDPARAIQRVRELESDAQTLRRELEQRPPATVVDELEAARAELAETRKERDGAKRAAIELEGRLNRHVAELENATQFELTNAALSSSIEAYKQEIRELRSQFDQLTASSTAETAFPECRDMDREFDGKRPVETQAPGALDEFIEDLQVRMSYDRQAAEEGRRLNYRLEDLRIFVSGLAMSRLHLLEGVSGTGKTTLPRAFAEAIGAGCKTIEVQAGWRDRQDLLGYYNSFERVYRESECLQWLYRAGLPYYADVPILIILDEMNLSHPEQYFADFLSVLENPGSPIALVDRKVPDPPHHMDTRAGVQLLLPRNVWFVGTANQDETTFGFAPKTYDRAHVMDLRPDAPAVSGDAPRARPKISLSGLEAEFRSASERYASDAATAMRFVADLEPVFNEKFRVGWGHRLNKHIERFVPVNIACGGSLGEALDHLASTKLMKKISGRHSLRRQSLEELADAVKTAWPDPRRGPKKTLDAIQNEIHELSFG